MRTLAALLAVASLGPAGSALADGGAPAAKAVDDEVRPTGREIVPLRERPDPAAVPIAACSFDEPVCVRAASSVEGGAVLSTLRHAEHALRGLRALGLPAPLPRVGGGVAHDLYLVPGTPEPATFADLAPTADGWDRASAYSILPPPSRRAGCASAATVARAITHAVALRFDAGVESGAASMLASYVASLIAPCPGVEIAAIDDFQRRPERSFIAGDPARADGAMLFPWFLDEAYGRGSPARVMAALLALAAQKTPPGALQWNNEPDVFDVLRATMKDRGSTVDQLLLDFAVTRAFVGSRSDGAHLADVERFGDAGRVRFEWSFPFDSLPRRVQPGRPVEATGATYLWLDLASAPPGAELTFLADWELPSVFRWALVKVDKNGAEAGRLDAGGVFGSSHAERTLLGLDGLAGVLIVGVNAGSMDRSHPFDPDEQPLMPHGYTVWLSK